MPKKYIFLTNIPAPYRVAMYNELHRQGLDFEVYYMRRTERDRSWRIDESKMRHPFYIDSGFYAMIGRFHIHFNPRLLVRLFRQRHTDVIVGGGWNDPDVLVLALLKRLRIFKGELHFWSEANFLTIGARRENVAKRLVRRFVYNSSRGAQISSGKMTELTMEKWGIGARRFIPLPNTIEEERFDISDAELVIRYANPVATFLMPVRLTERIKGIVNFFSCIGDENTRRARFLIAGDGPDENLVRRFIQEHQLEGHIQLCGFCDTDRLAALYKQAHVFLLPSFTDASPLALVEALRMHLPVLVSERCGNHYEAVIPGANGYLLDPSNPVRVRQAFETMMLRIADWPEMGEVSAECYRAVFDREVVIQNFIRGLTAFAPTTVVPGESPRAQDRTAV